MFSFQGFERVKVRGHANKKTTKPLPSLLLIFSTFNVYLVIWNILDKHNLNL